MVGPSSPFPAARFVNARTGMNDVLPKPFTKEGLLHMLEKHLAHLKDPAHGGMESMVPPHIQALNPGLIRPSLKEEDSPAKSPAPASNWNSPNQMPVVSPVASTSTTYEDHPNIPQGHTSMYAVQNPQVSPLNQGYMPNNPAAQMQMQQRQGQHRRQISDISGGDETANNAKRHQMYPPMQQHPQQNQRR